MVYSAISKSTDTNKQAPEIIFKCYLKVSLFYRKLHITAVIVIDVFQRLAGRRYQINICEHFVI